MKGVVIKFVVWLLKGNLSLQHRSVLLKSILGNLQVLPLHEIIQASESGSLIIKGKELDYEELGMLKESAKALRDNRVYGLIQDQVLFEAMTQSLASTNFEQSYFFKAAVWWGRRENELTKMIAGSPDLSG